MRLFAAAVALSALGATPVQAQEMSVKTFEGASITVIGGVDDSSSRVGALYGGQAGYDWQSNKIVFGVEGEVTGAVGKHCTNIYYTGGGSDRSCFKPGRDFYVGGRVGLIAGTSTLLYTKVGYTNARQSFEYPVYPVGGSASPRYLGSGTTDGFRAGAGIEQRLANSLTVKAEYRYSNYESGYSRHQGVVGIGFRF